MISNHLSRLFVCLVLVIYLGSCFSATTNVNKLLQPNYWEQKLSTCTTEDLDHSNLIECGKQACDVLGGQIWPLHREDVIHLSSSRSGDRFKLEKLRNLDYIMTAQEELLNINTTLRVETKSKKQKIYGIGASIDLAKFFSNGSIDHSLGLILRDLLSSPKVGIQMVFLRIKLQTDFVARNNVVYVIKELDKLIEKISTQSNNQEKVQMIFTIDGMNKTQDIIEVLRVIMGGLEEANHLECWAITIDKDWLLSNPESNLFLSDIRDLLTPKNLMSLVNMKEAPSFIDRSFKSPTVSLDGLIIKAEFSSVYNILDYVRNSSNSLIIMSMGSDWPKTSDYGDWENAKNNAIEIMNHFKHGSNGFLETYSTKNILPDTVPFDSLIYQLPSGYFRGPIFYSVGHFSLHVTPGSWVLDSQIATSPNMYAAHYMSFMTKYSDYVVTIVINDNEHILPFQLVVDGRVVTQVNMKPKSFNSLVTKII